MDKKLEEGWMCKVAEILARQEDIDMLIEETVTNQSSKMGVHRTKKMINVLQHICQDMINRINSLIETQLTMQQNCEMVTSQLENADKKFDTYRVRY